MSLERHIHLQLFTDSCASTLNTSIRFDFLGSFPFGMERCTHFKAFLRIWLLLQVLLNAKIPKSIVRSINMCASSKNQNIPNPNPKNPPHLSTECTWHQTNQGGFWSLVILNLLNHEDFGDDLEGGSYRWEHPVEKQAQKSCKKLHLHKLTRNMSFCRSRFSDQSVQFGL